MKKILFPTDFSPAAANAFDYALQLAKALDAKVDLMSVYHLPLNDAGRVPPDYIERMLEEKRQSVEKRLKDFVAGKPSKQIGQMWADYGLFVYQEIIDAARNKGYQLIVMGSKGERAGVEKLMGSVTTHTMMHAPCPVLAIPETATFQPVRHIGYATDFEYSDKTAVGKLMEFAGTLGAAIHFVHIDIKGTAGKMEDYVMVENYPLPFTDFSVISSKSVIEGLEAFMQEKHIEILALFIPNRRLWERLFHSSFTKRMAFYTKAPLLVFRE
ncbi:MAG: universal stress protein [Phaeodactylibacter sp.]|nr:universal stress protein [Phaeodactylibacter sp.]MCB9302536.1 universal stress protein [Lewinellaceae bacterium]HQU57894.1 universal stress protein [Saprospiraceae bacterium]